MRKLLIVLCLGLSVAAVSANNIQFWFSTDANVTTAAATGALNTDLPAPVGSTTTRLYLYANTPGTWTSMWDPNYSVYFTGWGGDVWEGVSMDLFFTGGGSLGADNKVHNLAASGLVRWNSGSDFVWTPINLVAISERGIGGANNASTTPPTGFFDGKQYCSAAYGEGNSGTLTTQVGWIAFTGVASSEVYMSVGLGGIARRNGLSDTDTVQFGTGDSPLLGKAFGAHSTLYDAKYLPEPASLLLLGLAGLALRRR